MAEINADGDKIINCGDNILNLCDQYLAQINDLFDSLEKINKTGIGPGGLGGSTTALAVNILTYPTHIAGLPVAINICCHVNRHCVRIL